jgi:hypothetical protein
MKKYILLICAFLSIKSYAQDSIKITRGIYYNIHVWPDTNNMIARCSAEYLSGFLITFPALEKDKRIKIQEYTMIEKKANAIITKDSGRANAFWVYPLINITADNKQVPIELELWVRINKKNLFYPVSKNGEAVFDNVGTVIYRNVKWQEMSKSFQYSNGQYLLGTMVLAVGKKR